MCSNSYGQESPKSKVRSSKRASALFLANLGQERLVHGMPNFGTIEGVF